MNVFRWGDPYPSSVVIAACKRDSDARTSSLFASQFAEAVSLYLRGGLRVEPGLRLHDLDEGDIRRRQAWASRRFPG